MTSILLITIVGCLVYSNSIYNEFHYDDIHSIVENFHIRDVNNWGSFFLSTEYFSIDKKNSMYRPILLLTYGINYLLGGYSVVGYHVFNIAIHISNSILVSAILTGLGYSRSAGILAGLLFVVHPLASEPVNYISSRSDSLAALFYLGAFLFYIYWCKDTLYRNKVGFMGCFCLALLSKSSAMSLVLVIPLYDYVYNFGFKLQVGWREVWKRYRGFLGIASLYISVLMITGFLNASLKEPVRGLTEQFLTQVKALVFYLQLALVPTGLNVDHQFYLGSKAHLVFWSSLLLLLSIFVVIIVAKRLRIRALLFFPSWALISLLPVTIMPLNVLVNERRIYLATIALCALIAITCSLSKYKSKLLLVGVFLIGIFAGNTFQRNEVWSDEFSLWNDSIHKAPLGVRPYLYLGNAYKDLAMSLPLDDSKSVIHWKNAQENYQIAIDNAEGSGPLALRALNNLGAICFSLADYDGAESAYRLALELDPYFVDALVNLGTIYHNKGRSAKEEEVKIKNIQTSVDYYEKAVYISSNHPTAWTNIGLAYSDLGRLAEAKEAYDRALFLNPNNPRLWSNIGGYHLLLGNRYWNSSKDSTVENYQKAVKYLAKSLELDPHHKPTRLTFESVNKVLSKWKP